MRVLLAMAGAEHGGAEGFFERLALGMKRHGVALRVVMRRDAARAERLAAVGLAPAQLKFGGVFDFATRPAFRRAIAEFKPDIVLTFMNRASAACPRRGGDGFVQIGRLGGYYKLKYYRGCDHLVGNTPDIVDYIVKRGWPAERAHYVPNFVDSLNTDPEPRERHNTPPEAPLVLALGRLHVNKAFDVLLAALTQLPDTYLWLAGTGPEEMKLREFAFKLGAASRVRFLGWRNDTAPLFAAADVVCVPSRHEPLGNVVIEAWARGKPVVAAASHGPRQLIASGENGLLVPVDDDKALAFALRHVIDETKVKRHLADNGYATYRQHFTEEAVVKRYLELFQAVLAERAPAAAEAAE
jgi:glycosyltransferase involved in cell wall biosynthesis